MPWRLQKTGSSAGPFILTSFSAVVNTSVRERPLSKDSQQFPLSPLCGAHRAEPSKSLGASLAF